MLVHVNGNSNDPVFQQIVDQVKAAVARGACQPGEMIPSVRQMAAQALVNPNTVAKAYRELDRDGVLTTSRGLGVCVARGAPERCRQDRLRALRERVVATVTEARRAGIPATELRAVLEEVLREHDEPE